MAQPTTMDKVLTELQEIRDLIKDTKELLARKASWRALWLTWLSIGLAVSVGVGGVVYAINADHRSCQDSNDAREAIRNIGVELSAANAEALIAIAGEQVTPELVEAYRHEVRTNAEAAVAELEDREC